MITLFDVKYAVLVVYLNVICADFGDIFAIFSFDYLIDHSEEKTVDSWLVGFDWGYGLLSFFNHI